MIEHLMKVVLNVCTRIAVLHNGALIADGAPREVIQTSLWSTPISARQYARNGTPPVANSLIIELKALNAGYGEIQALWGIDLEVRWWRDHQLDRLQWRRQDHADAGAVRPGYRRRRVIIHRRPRPLPATPPPKFWPYGIVHVPEDGGCSAR